MTRSNVKSWAWLTEPSPALSPVRRVTAIVLGVFLVFAGTSHVSFARDEFQSQVPGWLPLDADVVVVASGAVEIGLGACLILMRKHRVPVGFAVALFFLAVFPGNIAQYMDRRPAFGLDSDTARLIRLFFQPLLVLWALASTGAWRSMRQRNKHH